MFFTADPPRSLSFGGCAASLTLLTGQVARVPLVVLPCGTNVCFVARVLERLFPPNFIVQFALRGIHASFAGIRPPRVWELLVD